MRPRKRARILYDEDEEEINDRQPEPKQPAIVDNESSILCVSGSTPEPRPSPDATTSPILVCSQRQESNSDDDDDDDDLELITISSLPVSSLTDKRKSGLSLLKARRRTRSSEEISLSDKSESPDSYDDDDDDNHSDISDFIVEDGGSTLAELPETFSLRNRSGDPEDQFDSIIEQLVHYYVCDKDITVLDGGILESCVGQLDRQMCGCCDALISSAWTSDVVDNIKRSPHLSLEYQPNPDRWGFCECCQSQRDAITDCLVLVSSTTSLTSDTLIESLVKHPPLDSSPDGQSIYYVGSTCARRAQLVHTMIHWKRTVAQQVESLVYSCPLYKTFIKEAKTFLEHNSCHEAVSERKIALAQQIVDNLRLDRTIQTQLWPHFQSTLDAGVAFLTHNGKQTKEVESFFQENNHYSSIHHVSSKQRKILNEIQVDIPCSTNGRITDYFTSKKRS